MQVVLNSLKLIELLAGNQPIGVSELARLAELPKSTVFRILRALADAGWARSEQGGSSRWTLTSKAILVGSQVSQGGDLRSTVLPIMEELRRLTEETVHLAVLEASHVVIIDRLDSPLLLRSAYPLGFSLPAHAASTGKAILAFMDPAIVNELIGDELDRYTDRTLNKDEFFQELAAVRIDGYACNRGEFRADISSVAVPIFDHRSEPVAAISVSAPTQRMTPDRYGELGSMLTGATARTRFV